MHKYQQIINLAEIQYQGPKVFFLNQIMREGQRESRKLKVFLKEGYLRNEISWHQSYKLTPDWWAARHNGIAQERCQEFASLRRGVNYTNAMKTEVQPDPRPFVWVWGPGAHLRTVLLNEDCRALEQGVISE